MFNLRRKHTVEALEANRFRWAKTLLASFARGHDGVFMLDGSAVGADPAEPRGNKLAVYCVFPDEHMNDAIAEARKMLSPLSWWDIEFQRANRMSSLLGLLERRAIVVGERRRTKR